MNAAVRFAVSIIAVCSASTCISRLLSVLLCLYMLHARNAVPGKMTSVQMPNAMMTIVVGDSVVLETKFFADGE